MAKNLPKTIEFLTLDGKVFEVTAEDLAAIVLHGEKEGETFWAILPSIEGERSGKFNCDDFIQSGYVYGVVEDEDDLNDFMRDAGQFARVALYEEEELMEDRTQICFIRSDYIAAVYAPTPENPLTGILLKKDSIEFDTDLSPEEVVKLVPNGDFIERSDPSKGERAFVNKNCDTAELKFADTFGMPTFDHVVH